MSASLNKTSRPIELLDDDNRRNRDAMIAILNHQLFIFNGNTKQPTICPNALAQLERLSASLTEKPKETRENDG